MHVHKPRPVEDGDVLTPATPEDATGGDEDEGEVDDAGDQEVPTREAPRRDGRDDGRTVADALRPGRTDAGRRGGTNGDVRVLVAVDVSSVAPTVLVVRAVRKDCQTQLRGHETDLWTKRRL